jgi:hypothetical protein
LHERLCPRPRLQPLLTALSQLAHLAQAAIESLVSGPRASAATSRSASASPATAASDAGMPLDPFFFECGLVYISQLTAELWVALQQVFQLGRCRDGGGCKDCVLFRVGGKSVAVGIATG